LILGFGIVSSLIFIYCYPLKGFNINTNIKDYPIYVYILFLFFTLIYIFIFPFILVNIINSAKFIEFKENFINKCINNTEPNYMDENNRIISRSDSNLSNASSSTTPGSDESSNSISTIRNNNANNEISVIGSELVDISNNNSNNPIRIERRNLDASDTLTLNNNRTNINEVSLNQQTNLLEFPQSSTSVANVNTSTSPNTTITTNNNSNNIIETEPINTTVENNSENNNNTFQPDNLRSITHPNVLSTQNISSSSQPLDTPSSPAQNRNPVIPSNNLNDVTT
jgi:hypothetical protein